MAPPPTVKMYPDVDQPLSALVYAALEYPWNKFAPQPFIGNAEYVIPWLFVPAK